MGWLSTYFLAPALLGFLGLIPVVVLLYILKLRRTEVLVSSTMLWLKSLQDLTANAPFQRLRKNLLLLLQILVLLMLGTALARPFIRATGAAGTNVCLLIDRSASMQTVEDNGTRIELAKQKAREIIEDMRGGDKAMVVSFADRAEVLCELTGNRVRLRSAIDSIEATDTPTRIRDAVLVAHSLQRGNIDPALEEAPGEMPAGLDLRVIVIGDGKIEDLHKVGTRALDVTFAQVGETTANAGIVAFSDREPPEGAGSRQAFVLVHNEHSEPLATTLSLYFNDALLTVEEVEAPAGGDAEVVFAHENLGQGLLRAELDREDRLAVDNVAWLALRPAAFIEVLLVTEGDSVSGYYLKRALMLEPRVELSAVTPGNYADTDEYDLIIFDSFAPEALPQGSLLFLNAVPPVEGVVSTGEIDRPPILAKDAEHPVMRFMNPATVGIAKAIQVRLPAGARSLLSTDGGPLIADVSRGGQQILVVTFDIADSSWPWHLSFPLFLQNVVTWVPRSGLAQEQSVATGSPLTLLPEPDVAFATVEREGGVAQRVELDPMRPTHFGGTERAGLYAVTRGEAIEQFAVNLLSRNESAIRPAAALPLGRGKVEGVRGPVRQNKELWRWFVFAAVVLLAGEWWIYSRRAWI